jgi:hypothetical protein
VFGRSTGNLTKSFALVLMASLAMLMTGGLLLDVVRGQTGHSCSFFRYHLRYLDLPFWFAAILVQLGFNGAWIPGLSRLLGSSDFSPFQKNGRVTWDIPVQYGILFGKNLVLVVAILFAFLITQQL